MSENYILLKVHGNWIDREQIKGMFIMKGDPRIEVVSNGLITVKAVDKISAFDMHHFNATEKKEIEKMTKECIAKSLGFFLLEEGLIRFDKKISWEMIETTGSVLVVKDHETEKEGEQK